MNNVMYFLLGFCTCLVIAAMLFRAYHKVVTARPRVQNGLDEFTKLLALIEFFCNRTYNMYFQIKLNPTNMIHEPLTDLEYQTYRKEYYKMVLDAMGPELQNLSIFYFGTAESFMRHIASFFEEKLIGNRVGPAYELFSYLNNNATPEELSQIMKKYSTEITSVTETPNKQEG